MRVIDRYHFWASWAAWKDEVGGGCCARYDGNMAGVWTEIQMQPPRDTTCDRRIWNRCVCKALPGILVQDSRAGWRRQVQKKS